MCMYGMTKKITLKELALISKFSVSTISKALSDNREISDETKKKIKALAKEYNYRPNINARNLKSQKTKTIGVIIPNILAHYFAKVLLGIEQEVSKKGYSIITCISDESYEKETKSIELFNSGCVDGFLISLSKETQINSYYDEINDAIDQGLPVVMFDRTSDKVNCDKVIINDFESAYEATQLLIKSNRKKIIFVSPIAGTNVGSEREKGYKKAISDSFNGKIKPEILNFTDYSEFSETLNRYLDHPHIDGIVASDELSAIYAMNLAISKGYKVPENLSVIGFTDGILSNNSNPPLSIVDQHEIELGKIAAATLIQRIESNETTAPQTIILPTELILRKSTHSIG
jgi:LacI family transcriptional regulator